jgi:tRNA 2-thiouridine synthesizing protein B
MLLGWFFEEFAMLHIVRYSPFESRLLDECLSLMGATDSLLLVQDGVISACVPHIASQLQAAGVSLYVLAEDLLARGLCPMQGEVIDMAGFVHLVAEQGSPLRW